ncbi:MAG: hypothetical protein QOH10_2439, partial [Actinomycetota bacterium]|nr:hypothetical protein [Actinomycetota bacterium]
MYGPPGRYRLEGAASSLSRVGLRNSGDAYERAASELGSGSDGFTLIELVVAVSLLAVVAGGFVASLGLGFKTIALARQRQTAASIAEARLEHLRSIPYTRVALPEALTNSADTANPDHGVSLDGATFDIDGHGTMEPLIVVPPVGVDPGGGVRHLEDPVTVGTTVMEVYQYVTWVDDAGIPGTQDYRRATVIVVYKSAVVNGISRVVRASAIFSSGSVSIGGTTTTAAPSTTVAPTTTVPPTTTTTLPQSACPGDHAAPAGTAKINGTSSSEAGFTAGQNVSLNLTLSDACTPIKTRVANSGGTWSAWTTYDPANPLFSWALTTGDALKQVDVEVTDNVGNTAALTSVTIILDTTKPTVPGTLTRIVSCSGTDRTVTLSWGIATDTNFRGYRIYRSTDGVSWSVFSQVSQTTATDATLKKSLDSVRYYVVAY